MFRLMMLRRCHDAAEAYAAAVAPRHITRCLYVIFAILRRAAISPRCCLMLLTLLLLRQHAILRYMARDDALLPLRHVMFRHGALLMLLPIRYAMLLCAMLLFSHVYDAAVLLRCLSALIVICRLLCHYGHA